jgi:hypothetical protein
VRTWAVLSGALAMYRRFPARVAGTAAVVFVPVMLLEVAIHGHVAHAPPTAASGRLADWILAASSGVAIAFGELLFSGMIDESVGAAREGHPPPGVIEVVRSLPIRTLLAADLILLLLFAAAASLLALPAVALVTLTCITGPVIIVERRSAVSSIRRSSALVWPHAWTALLAVGIPIAIEGAVAGLAIGRSGTATAVAVMAVGAVFGITVAAFTGLCEVVLGRTLIDLDRASR